MRTNHTLIFPALVLATVTNSFAQPATTFTKIITGDIVNDAGIGWGAAWGDFDNDGFIDLAVANEGADFLYRNNRDGTFTRITNSPIVADEPDGGAGLAFADYDNDGHLDLVVAGYGGGVRTKLFRNNGDGTFTDRVANPLAASDDASSANWGDFDNDGHLDLMITMLGPANLLYRNNQNGSFTKVTSATVGRIASDSGQAIAGIWGDYDNDGDLDMFVTNFNLTNAFYRNNGNSTFTRLFQNDIGDLATASLNPEGAAWGDYDNDGDLDVFTAQGGATAAVNDSLYRNNGNGTFTKMTADIVGPLVNDLQTGAGCSWADFDNDGWLDLFVANPGRTLIGEQGRKNLLYRNNRNGSFTQSTDGNIANDVAASESGIWGDYDNDGFMDLFLANGGFAGRQADNLFRNEGNTNAWLKLKLIGTSSNRSAIGAKVRIKATINGTNFWQMREISGGDGFFSQNDPRPNFGLGNATNAEIVRIEWPSGIVQEFHNVAGRQILHVTEPPRLEPTLKVMVGVVEMKVRGWTGLIYGVEASVDLKNWTNIGIATNLSGTVQVPNGGVGTNPLSFYRLVVP